jgi:YfiH family protein
VSTASVPVVRAAALSALPGIRHAFFTRHGGVSDGIYATLNGGVGSGDVPERVRENRARMAAAVGATPENFLTAYQVHSPDVIVAEKPWPGDSRPRADAIVTRAPGLAIGISTADCGPVLLADAQARVIGAAHAGWRGALGGVLEAVLKAMENLGAQRSRIVAALGPMISQQNYEVGGDLVEKFTAASRDNARFFGASARNGHAQFDLPGYIVDRLRGAGVTQVENVALCTYADAERFYSYRRTTHCGEPDYGRHISAIALEG